MKTQYVMAGLVGMILGLGGRAVGGEPHPGNGQPAVLVGADQFATRPVTTIPGGEYSWFCMDIFDQAQGLELACTSFGHILFVDPKTLQPKRTVPIKFGPPCHELRPVSLRRDGRLNLYSAGGGFTTVGLYDLQGNSLWTFQPSGNLPPSRMVSADLDADGEQEFYVADSKGVFRLDTAGQVVWQRGLPSQELVTLPAAGRHPALVVGSRGSWDAHGKAYSMSLFGGRSRMLQRVSWDGTDVLASGETSGQGSRATLMDVDGKVLFRQKIGERFGVGPIVSVRFQADAAPYLVVIGGGGSSVRLVEVNIFAHDGRLVYKALREPARLVVVPDGRQERLLLCGLVLESLGKR